MEAGAAYAFTGAEHALASAREGADVIAEGTITGFRYEQGDGFVFVHYSLRVERLFRGPPLDVVEVTVPGGMLDDGSHIIFPGAPYFQPEDHVVLHLASWGTAGTYRMNSWTEGVLRDHDGLAFLGGDGVPLPAWSCHGEHRGTAADASSVVDSDEPDGDDAAEGEGERQSMAWADAVSIVESCVGEVLP